MVPSGPPLTTYPLPALSSTLAVWYEPSDLSSLWQDTAGTVPVTTVGQPVRRMNDRSGNGRHVTFAGSAPPTLSITDGGLLHLLPADSSSRGMSSGWSLAQPYASCLVVDTSVQAASPKYHVIFDSLNNNGGSFVALNTPTTAGTRVIVAEQVAGLDLDNFTPLGVTTVYAVSSSSAGLLSLNGIDRLSGNAGSKGLSNLSLFNITGNPNPIVTNYESTAPFFRLLLISGIPGAVDKAAIQAWAAALPVVRPNYGVIGDSTVTAYSGSNAVASYLPYTKAAISVANAGDTIAQQRTKWDALSAVQYRAMSAVFVQIGLNDLDPAESAATAVGRLQSLITKIRADIAAASPIVLATMVPCRSRLISVYGGTNGPIAYAKWLSINESIAGIGANAITGVEYRVTSHTAAMGDGAGNLAAAYDTGDGIHPNNAGRQVNANAWAAALPSV
jgi:lysophospholipase L1-like esterase